MSKEMAPEPCGDPTIDPDVQAFMDIYMVRKSRDVVWPKGSYKPIETIDVPAELL